MPKPIALCIEDLDDNREAPRYLRCVALGGRVPGLGLDEHGEVIWQRSVPLTAELWVSGDERLMLLRPQGSVGVTVTRSGRCVQAPYDKPVVLLDSDELTIGSRRLGVHVHGRAPRVHPPAPLPERSRTGVTKVAAVLAIGASAIGCPNNEIEIRDRPPDMAESEPTVTAPATTTSAPPTIAADAGVATEEPDGQEKPPGDKAPGQ